MSIVKNIIEDLRTSKNIVVPIQKNMWLRVNIAKFSGLVSVNKEDQKKLQMNGQRKFLEKFSNSNIHLEYPLLLPDMYMSLKLLSKFKLKNKT